MKAAKNCQEKIVYESMRTPSSWQWRASSKLMLLMFIFVLATYAFYLLKLVSSSHVSCDEDRALVSPRKETFVVGTKKEVAALAKNSAEELRDFQEIGDKNSNQTTLENIVFGIAASSDLWERRKEYIKLWWRPEKRMRGIVWLDKPVKTAGNESRSLPKLRISGDISKFAYKNNKGHRSAIRISRILSETLRSRNTDNVRWFVMGDDDTIFVTDNLVRVLNKYDHTQFFYIGSSSESHLQNIHFSYNMAYGGGGFAISFPLAKAIEKMQDRCIQRYPGLYGSDDRMQACMAELGIPLTKEVGFHQYDVYGDLFGLLAAHPVTPFVSLHHVEVVDPIFPNKTQVEALRKLLIPMELDSAGLLQQSICYDRARRWSISVSWGFAVQIFRGVLSPRELEMTSRTFLNWYKRADYTAYAFNTRPVARNPCQKPFVFYLSNARMDTNGSQTLSEYTRHHVQHPVCTWAMADPSDIQIVEVHKKPDPHLWDRSPRRNCCRIVSSAKKSVVIDVGLCREGEVIEV